jgi:hypothetical protein
VGQSVLISVDRVDICKTDYVVELGTNRAGEFGLFRLANQLGLHNCVVTYSS